MYGELCPYTQAPWIKKLNNIPPVKVKLAMTPTPIHEWKLPGVPQNFQVYIKRDDLTGSALTGNKIRKLEYIFGHILQNGYKNVITNGGILSNHCRATAIFGARLGVKVHLLLESDLDDLESHGNIFLSQMCSAKIYLIPICACHESALEKRYEALAEEIFRVSGEKSYSLALGGSNSLGLYGYLDAWQEMMEQRVQERFDDIVVVLGSGGTAAGLAIGNYLTGSKVKVHAISISRSGEALHNHINELIKEAGLEDIKSEDVVDIIEGHIGAGYGTSTDEDHKFCQTVASTTGILCDPVYTGKGAKGLISELNSNPGRFQGNKVLFVHTGGIFDMYGGRMFNMFSNEKVHDWHEIAKPPRDFL